MPGPSRKSRVRPIAAATTRVPPQNTVETTSSDTERLVRVIGNRLRTAREDADLSLMEACFRLWAEMPRVFHASTEKIRRYEQGKVPFEDLDVFHLAALAYIYEQPLADIAPGEVLKILEESVERLRTVLDHEHDEADVLP